MPDVHTSLRKFSLAMAWMRPAAAAPTGRVFASGLVVLLMFAVALPLAVGGWLVVRGLS